MAVKGRFVTTRQGDRGVHMKIKKSTVRIHTHHLGTYALPSGHAISVHVKGSEWLYSEPVEGLKPEDREYFEKEIATTLGDELKKKCGENRHRIRRMKVLLKRTAT